MPAGVTSLFTRARTLEPSNWLIAIVALYAAFRVGMNIADRGDLPRYWQFVDATSGIPGWNAPWEYPPLAGLIAAGLAFTYTPAQAIGYWTALTLLATAVTVVAIWRSGGDEKRRRWAIIYLLATIAVLQQIYTARMDAFTVTTTVLALLALARGRDRRAGLWLAIGGLIKGWPFLLLGVVGGLYGRWRVLATAATILVAVTLAGMFSGAQPWAWVTFAMNRDLQVETFAALPAMWAIRLGSTAYTVTEQFYGATIEGPGLVGMRVGILLALGLLVAVLGWRARRTLFTPRSRSWSQPQAAFLLLVVTASLIGNVVLSPQYLLWIGAILIVALLRGWLVREALITLAAAWLSGILFPVLWEPFAYSDGWPPLLLFTVRQALIVALLASLTIRLWRAGDETSLPLADVVHLEQGEVPADKLRREPHP